MNYTKHFNLRDPKTPQHEAAYGTVPNNAGGYAFEIDIWKKLDRFLILGTEGGTYYVSERKLTRDNAKNLELCIQTDGKRTVDRIIEISHAGRAPKNDAALFALAMCTGIGDIPTRQYALNNLSKVARIGTHLFLFAEYIKAFRGWGRSLKRAVANWYDEKTHYKLIYQVIKYQQRNGWSHCDLLRLSHPKSSDESQQAIYNWICANGNTNRKKNGEKYFSTLATISKLTSCSKKELCTYIKDFKLPREIIPTESLQFPDVWEALLIDMPLTAIIRNLGKMTSIGLIGDFSNAENLIIEKLSNLEYLQKSRLHPLTILTALLIYQQGHGMKGSLSWSSTTRIIETLEQAFYNSFKNVIPTNKRIMLALDISGSMECNTIAGSPMTPRMAAAALAMVTKKTETQCIIKGFSDVFIDLNITTNMSLQEVIAETSRYNFGGTDCSLPMVFAQQRNIPIDAFVVLTDNETWSGDIYPSEALQQYRKSSGRPAKLIICAMEANEFTIADPNDAGMLDVVGFDTATPNIISDFIRK